MTIDDSLICRPQLALATSCSLGPWLESPIAQGSWPKYLACGTCTQHFGQKSALWAKRIWPILFLASALFLVATAHTTVLFHNYIRFPLLFAFPALAVGSLVVGRIQVSKGNWRKAWAASAFTIFAITLFGILGMYPAIIISSIAPSSSLTIHNASSSPLTLTIMLFVALIFVPIVMLYQGWVYRLFSQTDESRGNRGQKGLY